ncbi:hypothetical protein APS56_01050 [Pseudalgibacter alginicilyticus]|uniref:Response regulatory domain-containing protein n=1 Tax=Pseudalgibacter alginicilyticus TaxID=1736674 RepID=A0A0P0CD71_9FLAO|nr:response regulator [Pseudalgibacter alginicilyticus]ALJ03821.1 hypothetical protein APS56_01050 [Pseudalgibacter alginicilyticus]
MNLEEVLLIDDNNIDNYINKFIVGKSKITTKITVQCSPVEALDYLKHMEGKFPKLIFLDIKMPEMDGFGFLEIFDKFPAQKKENCNIVMLTSSHNQFDIERANNNPYVKKYLIKPLDLTKLKDVLKDVFAYV